MKGSLNGRFLKADYFNGVLFKTACGYLACYVALRNQFYVLSAKPEGCFEFVSMITFISSDISLSHAYSVLYCNFFHLCRVKC